MGAISPREARIGRGDAIDIQLEVIDEILAVILLNVDQTCVHVSIGVRPPFSDAFGRVLTQVSMASKQLGDASRIGIENRSNDRLKISQGSAKRETMPHSNLTSFTEAGTKDFIDRSSVFRA
jgi:hypothetical protein